MQCCCYFPLIVLYILWERQWSLQAYRAAVNPAQWRFSPSCCFSLFSHISNGRRHAGSQHGGSDDTGEGRGCVSHLISVPMETDGWRIPLPLTCNLWRLGQWLVASPTYCTCHAHRFSLLLFTETAAAASLLFLSLAPLTVLEESC